MSFGLPNHLAPSRVSGAIARACHSVAWMCISFAGLGLGILQFDDSPVIVWPALLALAPMAVALAFLYRERTVLSAIAFLAIGAASTFWYSSTIFAQLVPETSNETFLIALPKIALIMVGGPALGTLAAVGWVAAGLVVAEGVVLLAMLGTAVSPSVDFATLAAAGILSAVYATVSLGRRSSEVVQPSIHRAARDEELARVRYRLELRAAALMHDTVLSQLAALATAPQGDLSPRMRESIQRDLELLVGEEWLSTPAAPATDESDREWRGSALSDAVELSRADGLHVAVSGDLSLVGHLAPAVAREVGLAARQCLVNVLAHAGTNRAELLVFDSGDGITVMVVDNGSGFHESETAADRMGLRASVRGRIVGAGGAVEIWSTVGQGTSVLLHVPKGSSDPSAEVRSPNAIPSGTS